MPNTLTLRAPLLLTAIALLALSCATASALPRLSHHGRWLTDPQGRVVILHGVQIDKYMPSQPVEGWLDVSPANVRFIAAEGFNVARVSMAYAGVEPQLGQFDRSYVRRYVAFDRELARSGVYDLIDMMQGEYSTLVGGGGFPDWMALTNGALNTRAPFAGGYLTNPAEEAVWDNLWANTPVSDRVGLQDHYADGLRRLARAFKRAPGLLALEILNEPWPGSRWAPCLGQAGCPAGGFDQTSLTSFYARVIAAMRTADRRHLIAYEPNLLFDFASPTRLGALPDGNLLFAFHNYCLAYAPGLPPNPALTASCVQSENDTFDNAEARAAGGGGALLLDEWGNTTDLTRVERMADEADQHMVGWSYWAYEDCCQSPAAIVTNAAEDPTAPGNLNLTELKALVRPYPQLVAGTPESWSYDSATRQFSLTYSPRPVGGGVFPRGTESAIELPALQYPTGYDVHLTGAKIASAPDANRLLVTAVPGARTVSVTVTSASHHPPAPGPFTWPATAIGIAAADCSATATHLIPIRVRAGDWASVRIVEYIDGKPVSIIGGRHMRWIQTPAGLADGSQIRLAVDVGGRRHTATWRLDGCLPELA